jgi:hypothetical protein
MEPCEILRRRRTVRRSAPDPDPVDPGALERILAGPSAVTSRRTQPRRPPEQVVRRERWDDA